MEELLPLLAHAVGARVWLKHTPPPVGVCSDQAVGLLLWDVVMTNAVPTGTTRLGDWLTDDADGVGRGYALELRRNYRR